MILLILISTVKAIFYADFISGVGHWLEDRYARVGMKLIEDLIVLPNLEHHKTPRSFLERSYWQRNDVLIVVTFGLFLCFWVIGILTITVGMTLVLLSQINEFHAMAHRKKKDNWKIVRMLQRIGLLQSAKHHNFHHAAPFECRYCILTEYLNTLLDEIKFFRILEWFIFQIFRIRPNSQ